MTVTGTIAAGVRTPFVQIFRVPDPAAFARVLMVEALERAGVAVAARTLGPNRVRSLPTRRAVGRLPRIARLTSPPVGQFVKLIQKVSHNLGANTVPFWLGVDAGRPTFEAGMQLIRAYATKAGVRAGQAELVDGQGGAPNRITPAAAVRLLRYVQTRPYGRVFLDALPIKGIDGIPGPEAAQDPATGNVFAKNGLTGALDANDRIEVQAMALAGYAIAGERRIAFSVVANNIPIYGPDGKPSQAPADLTAAFTAFGNHEGITSLFYTSQTEDSMRLLKSTIALLLVLLSWGTAAAASAAGPASGGLDPGTKFSPIVSEVTTSPTAVKATDGRFHIAYELILTNTAPLTMAVERLEVRDPRTRRVLSSISGAQLDRNMNPAADPGSEDPTTMAASETSVVWMDVAVRRASQLPRVLEHRLAASSRPPPGPQFTYRGLAGRIPLARSRIALGPPVRPGIWVANEGCCTNPTHHRRGLVGVDGILQVAQRHAIDWFRLDRRMNVWTGDPSRLTSYPSYRQPLIAAAAGRVVRARDGIRDNRPQGTLQKLPPIDETVGLGQITEPFDDEELALQSTGALTFKPALRPGVRRREMPLDNNVVRFR